MTANLLANVQPYLDALAQAADADHASSIVDETAAARGVFAFTELLHSPAVQQLKDTPAYSLIELFAFGNWRQWHDNHRKTIPLNAAQELKLRQLSLLSLANHSKTLTYASMQRELGLVSTAELESVIIDAFYQEIIQGKLSQARQELALESAVGRDVDLARDLPSLDVTVTAM
ncbi:hypothetical protein IWQ60_007981 [Tieghemiomyces parasiticus]|uniref:PCI domain-containing protein n=1 Tax=Tieghemiomyces parasiticus TaxID=78921 RepID=A0A9W7ZUN5_9FUNG|nr:hypothetical protein IWQ60_007981 [Tieghemiomyces parasiticus]